MNNINKLLSLNEDFNFNDFSKKVSNKDIVRIIKENNKKPNYITGSFYYATYFNDLFYNKVELDKIYKIFYNNIWYTDKNKFYELSFMPNKKIKIYFDNEVKCTSLFNSRSYKILDLSYFQTNNSVNMAHMFDNCYALEELKLKDFNTSKVTDMSYMFYNCESLKKLDLSSFNTSNVIYMDFMFCYCLQLKKLNLSSFDTSKLIPSPSIFKHTNFDNSELEEWIKSGGISSNILYPNKIKIL